MRVSGEYLLGDDPLVEDLLRAQTTPTNWTVARVQLFRAHAFSTTHNLTDVCQHCALSATAHQSRRPLRRIILLTNGPLRRLTFLTTVLEELPKPARLWLNTLYNVAEAANVRLDGWIAYDGKG